VERDGRPVFRDLRWGVYVTFAADSDYVRRCFKEYGLVTDDTGNYSATHKPFHLIGLELGISVRSAALRREPTGCPTGFRADAVATAKRDLRPGEVLDGEGGCTVWGRLMPVKARRPPSLHLVCEVFPDHSSFSVFRETPVAFSSDYFKKLYCYK